jgi:hypothetical protein
MTTNHMILAIIGTLSVTVLGCASDSNELDNSEHVRTWANAASAVGIYAHAYQPVAFADGQVTFADPACPTTDDDGTTVTITGGCHDSSNTEWKGSASIVRSGDGDKKVTLDDYGSFASADMRAGTTGTIDIRRIDASMHEFNVDLVHEGGITTTITYSGSVKGDYTTATTWNGSGEVEREGMVAPTGRVQATTVDQMLDDAVCAGQAVSGQTTIASGGSTAVITYDGATDCDEEKNAKWSLNGEDRGLIDGICCSAGAIGSAQAPIPSTSLVLVGVAGIVLVARRRRR